MQQAGHTPEAKGKKQASSGVQAIGNTNARAASVTLS